MKVFVVFGSASDEVVSKPLVEQLSRDFEVEFAVISAHRDLEKLKEKITSWKGDVIVAGAGLAAALPGVVAAMTLLPVFGVPVPSQFGGLDSLCSIAQMPPGVPVISCGPGKTQAIVEFLKQYRLWKEKGSKDIHFVVADLAALSHPDLLAELDKASVLAKDKGLSVTFSAQKRDGAFNVFIVTSANDVQDGVFCLHVPFFGKQSATVPENYLSVLDWTGRGGLWLGVNNTRNAVQSVLRLKGVA